MHSYYEAKMKRGSFEATTLLRLAENIANYYGGLLDTRPPEVLEIWRYQDDEETKLSQEAVRQLNVEIETRYEQLELESSYETDMVTHLSSPEYTGRV